MNITINNIPVEQTTLGNEPVWIEAGTTNIVGKVADIPNKDITWDTTEEQRIIGKRLRDARESKGINIYQFSVMTGITRTNIRYIESGVTAVGVQVLLRMCKALDIKADLLFVGMP